MEKCSLLELWYHWWQTKPKFGVTKNNNSNNKNRRLSMRTLSYLVFQNQMNFTKCLQSNMILKPFHKQKSSSCNKTRYQQIKKLSLCYFKLLKYNEICLNFILRMKQSWTRTSGQRLLNINLGSVLIRCLFVLHCWYSRGIIRLGTHNLECSSSLIYLG